MLAEHVSAPVDDLVMVEVITDDKRSRLFMNTRSRPFLTNYAVYF